MDPDEKNAIVLKNIRRDIPALKPLAAKVIHLQRQLIETVQRYQELNSSPDKDEAVLQQLLREIAVIDQAQREELNLVREAEMNYSSQESDASQGSNLYCAEELSSAESTPVKTDSVDESLDYRIEGGEILPKIQEEEPVAEEVDEPEEMDWEDLTREQWSETDRLLQKIERVGSKVLQQDFMSSVELVHVSQLKQAEESLAKRKLKTAQGKKVFTTGPWQMIDIPTKVQNRRCNYLTGLHVTIRPKDTKRPMLSAMENGGVKTRHHHDSRGSSRASSRASSPISSQTESSNNNKDGRSIKTRATKVKRAPSQQQSNNKTTVPPRSSPPSTTSSTTSSSRPPLEPCVTYTVVDGVPHFKVFFPSKESSNSSSNSGSNNNSPPTGSNSKTFASPHASIVESDIEIIQSNSSSSSSSSSGRENGHHTAPGTPGKTKSSVKAIKRPRLSQGFSPTPTKTNPSTPSSSGPAKRDEANKEDDIGLCIEKCGSWMGAPHFKIYRTFPSVNATVASSVADWPTAQSTTVKPTTSTPAPKLTSPISSPKVVPSKSAPLPAMPKLTMGNQGLNNKSPQQPAPSAASSQGKFVPIAPKGPMQSLSGSVSNFVIVPFADRSDKKQGQPAGTIKRPISLLKTCPPLSGNSGQSPGTFLTVKNLKECLQNNMQIKDMKVVVQKVPVTTTGADCSDDLKKKVVKLFPASTDSSKEEESAQHFPPPTVIVADMSM